MDERAGPADAGDTAWVPLIDVSQLSIRELFLSDDSTLAACVGRLVGNLDNADGILSGFQSFTS